MIFMAKRKSPAPKDKTGTDAKEPGSTDELLERAMAKVSENAKSEKTAQAEDDSKFDRVAITVKNNAQKIRDAEFEKRRAEREAQMEKDRAEEEARLVRVPSAHLRTDDDDSYGSNPHGRHRGPTLKERVIDGLKEVPGIVGLSLQLMIPISLAEVAYAAYNKSQYYYNDYQVINTITVQEGAQQNIDGGSCVITNVGPTSGNNWAFLLDAIKGGQLEYHAIPIGGQFRDGNNACFDGVKIHLLNVASNGAATFQIIANNQGMGDWWAGAVFFSAIGAFISSIILAYVHSNY